jgi:hypothetical protein
MRCTADRGTGRLADRAISRMANCGAGGLATSRRPGRAPGCAADRGSLTLFVIFFAMTALVLASLLVDVGDAVSAQERAADLAEQAARAGANAIDPGSLRAGNVVIDPGLACQAAGQVIQKYASISGIDATMTQDCTFPGPRQVTVYVSVTTQPIITTFFGSFTMRAHETACAEFGINQGVAC